MLRTSSCGHLTVLMEEDQTSLFDLKEDEEACARTEEFETTKESFTKPEGFEEFEEPDFRVISSITV